MKVRSLFCSTSGAWKVKDGDVEYRYPLHLNVSGRLSSSSVQFCGVFCAQDAHGLATPVPKPSIVVVAPSCTCMTVEATRAMGAAVHAHFADGYLVCRPYPRWWDCAL